MASRLFFEKTFYKFPTLCQSLLKLAPALSSMDTPSKFQFKFKNYERGIVKPKSFFPHFIFGIVSTEPIKYSIEPGNHPLIALRTNDDSPNAVFDIPDSGVRNFNLAMERGHLLLPKSSTVIAKVPDSINLSIPYEVLQDLPLKNVYAQSFHCEPGSEEKISVHVGHPLESSKALGIPTVDDYFKANLKDLDPNNNPFNGEDHFKQIHNLPCEKCGGATVPTFYPEGIPISLMKEGNNDWFFRDLPDVLGFIRASLKKIAGVLTSYVYFGTIGAAFPYHKEDGLLYSINVMLNVIGLPGQGEKMWLSIHMDDVERLEKLLKEENKDIPIGNLSKNIYIKSLEALAANGIRFQLIRQVPGTVVFTYGPHSGFNTGNVVNEALNAASLEWVGMNLRFPEDEKLRKPTRNKTNWLEGNAYKLSPVQISKDFSKASNNIIVVDGKDVNQKEPAIPAWNQEQKMRHFYLISQILLHKYRNLFKTDMSFIEIRRIIQAMVAFKLNHPKMSLSGASDWVEVRKIMGAEDKITKSRKKVNKDMEEDDGYESLLDDYIQKHSSSIFSDDASFHEYINRTWNWADRMFAESKDNLEPLLKEYKSLCSIPYNKSHEIFAIYSECMKEQREKDPENTWESTDGDTDFGREVRRNKEQYKKVIKARKKATTKAKSRRIKPTSGPKNDEDMPQLSPNNSQVDSSSPPTHNVQFETLQWEEPESSGFNPITTNSAKSFAAYFIGMDQVNRLAYLRELTHVMSPYERTYVEKRLAEMDDIDEMIDEDCEEDEEDEEEEEGEILDEAIGGGNFNVNEEHDLQVEGGGNSNENETEQMQEEEGGGGQKEIQDESTGMESGDKNEEDVESKASGNSDENRVGQTREEEKEESIGSEDKNKGEAGGMTSDDEEMEQMNVSPIVKPAQPKKRIPTRKFDTSTIVPEELTQFVIDEESRYIKELTAHLQEDDLTGYYPPIKINSMSGLLFETMKGKTKILVPNSNFYIRLFDVLVKGVDAEDFSSLLDKNKVKRRAAWENILGGSNVFSDDEVSEFVCVIITALNVDENKLGTEFKRLNAILRVLINLLWISAGKGKLTDFKEQLKWLLESAKEDQTEDMFIQSFMIPQNYESKFPGLKQEHQWDMVWEETVGLLTQFPHLIVGYEEELFLMTAYEIPREIALRNYVIEKMGAKKDEKEVHSPQRKRPRI